MFKERGTNNIFIVVFRFYLNWKNCELDHKRLCKFLAMIINSDNMSLELPCKKRVNIKKMLEIVLSNKKISIQNLADCIGVLVAACPGVAYGWLYYKELE